MLFEDIIFGPIKSRRLGNSLGVNLLPTHKKLCNFNCVYCECGWNEDTKNIKDSIHSKEDIKKALEIKLIEIKEKNIPLDSITFSGNGEPTIHPDFSEIIDFVVDLRNQYAKAAKISVLTNATTLNKEDVFSALHKIDNPILKLDSGTEEMFYAISKANPNQISFETVKEKLIEFGKDAIVQTLLIRGENEGKKLDNTTEEEFEKWLEIVIKINPRQVMLYAIDRLTPESKLEKLTKQELEFFANKIREIGIETKTY
ncbi:MAG: radical SAM protein [Bacteroidales bacterium]|jgi:wyosine [tRNA(Phe)-imidazoG37] synthetase (radical SAM superfamily)|nr:radical SAM protein [Bacteroidales bacterium]MDD4002179.1 radical SAM protein [Bacteroidales bacterium]MDD4528325.1 radical SAM protein [Bacteroidales bacterium]MDD4829176.1 radical SAM protein [Bacteroidales bacterium]